MGWFLIFALVAPAPAGASPSNEADFVARINSTRASVGLPPLTVDSQLTSVARSWAVQMRDGVCGQGNHICHASSLGAGITHSWAKLGENVGTGPTVADVHPAFVASPGHYANIVDPSFTHIGVGVVWDGNRLYTTHRFMALNAPPPTTTTAAPTTTTTAAPTTTTTIAPAPEPAPTTTAASTSRLGPILAAPASEPPASSNPQRPDNTTQGFGGTTNFDAPRSQAAAGAASAETSTRGQRAQILVDALIRAE